MANYYVSATVGGGGAGTEGDPWTFPEMVASANGGTVAAGDSVYVKADGVYRMSIQAITQAGASNNFIKLIGYSTATNDGGCPKLVRTAGTTFLLRVPHRWYAANFVLDAAGGSQCFRGESTVIIERIEAYSANSFGLNNGHAAVECYTHHNVGNGTQGMHYLLNCIAEKNSARGYVDTRGLYHCIARNNNSEGLLSPNMAVACVFDSGGSHQINANEGAVIQDCAFFNHSTAAVTYGVSFATNTIHSNIVRNVNFDQVRLTSNSPTQLISVFALTSQFISAPSFDYRRSGSNLDTGGRRRVGFTAFDYRVAIGIDQTPSDYPTVGDVRSLISYRSTQALGTINVPTASNVRAAIDFEASQGATGNVSLPAVANVKTGITYGASGSELTGTAAIPTAGDVRSLVSTGVLSGNLSVPTASDVRAAISFEASQGATGNISLPDAGNVKVGIGYGASGSELTGTYAPNPTRLAVQMRGNRRLKVVMR